MSLAEDDLLAAEYAPGVLDPAERATVAARRLREPDLTLRSRPGNDGSRRSPRPRRRSLPNTIFCPRSRPELAPEAQARDPGPRRERSLSHRSGTASLGAGGRLPLQPLWWRSSRLPASSALRRTNIARRASLSPCFRKVPTLRPSRSASISKRASSRCGPSQPSRRTANPMNSGSSRTGLAPRVLGVIDAGEITRAKRLAPYLRKSSKRATYAVTLEPPGGSPTGTPSRRTGIYRKAHPGRAVTSIEALPFHIVSGFLGAGKTTLVNRLLRDPALAGSPSDRQ